MGAEPFEYTLSNAELFIHSYTLCDPNQFEDPACAYSGGDMKYHHGYLGIVNTDENQVSTSCISEEVMRQKQHGALSWLLPVLVCIALFLCGCCCGICVVGRAICRTRGPKAYATVPQSGICRAKSATLLTSRPCLEFVPAAKSDRQNLQMSLVEEP